MNYMCPLFVYGNTEYHNISSTQCTHLINFPISPAPDLLQEFDILLGVLAGVLDVDSPRRYVRHTPSLLYCHINKFKFYIFPCCTWYTLLEPTDVGY